jgi:hypothetical protein
VGSRNWRRVVSCKRYIVKHSHIPLFDDVAIYYVGSRKPKLHDCGGLIALTTWHSLSAKVGTNFADKRRSLGRYIIRLRTQATEFLFVCNLLWVCRLLRGIRVFVYCIWKILPMYIRNFDRSVHGAFKCEWSEEGSSCHSLLLGSTNWSRKLRRNGRFALLYDQIRSLCNHFSLT